MFEIDRIILTFLNQQKELTIMDGQVNGRTDSIHRKASLLFIDNNIDRNIYYITCIYKYI